MSRRIEVELTSKRGDGTWTWRAAGARQPKGELSDTLVPDSVAVGDVVKVDADFLIEGIEILAVLAPKPPRREAPRIEVVGTASSAPGVTTQLAPRGRDRGRSVDRPPGDKRGRSGDRPPGDKRGHSSGGDESKSEAPSGRGAKDRPSRPPAQARSQKPKPKRLRPRRVHRNEVLSSVPEEQRPIAEQVLRGGLPAVRQAIDTHNESARSAGRPEIDPAPLIKMAEDLLPVLKAAEWRDRAEAAVAEIGEVSLTDLRSVVVAADGNARDESARALADQLRGGLAARVEREQAAWLEELSTATSQGRTVRALRLSSRPPKAGTLLPADLLKALADLASAALTTDVGSQRWGTVLDAVSYSPARAAVVPAGVPQNPSDELLATVRKAASRVPAIAAQFGVRPAGARQQRSEPPGPPVAPSSGLQGADPGVVVGSGDIAVPTPDEEE